MPREKVSRGPAHARARASKALTVPQWVPRRSARLQEHAERTQSVTTSTSRDNVATSSDESESDDDGRSPVVTRRGRQQQQQKTKTTTTTRRVAGARCCRATIAVVEDVGLAQRQPSPLNNDTLAKVVDLAARMEAHAQQNEVARVEERRDAQRFFREAIESNARQTELVATALRESMAASAKTFSEAIDAMTRQNQAIVGIVREMQQRAHDPTTLRGPRDGPGET